MFNAKQKRNYVLAYYAISIFNGNRVSQFSFSFSILIRTKPNTTTSYQLFLQKQACMDCKRFKMLIYQLNTSSIMVNGYTKD